MIPIFVVVYHQDYIEHPTQVLLSFFKTSGLENRRLPQHPNLSLSGARVVLLRVAIVLAHGVSGALCIPLVGGDSITRGSAKAVFALTTDVAQIGAVRRAGAGVHRGGLTHAGRGADEADVVLTLAGTRVDAGVGRVPVRGDWGLVGKLEVGLTLGDDFGFGLTLQGGGGRR